MLFVFLSHFNALYFVQDDPWAREFKSIFGIITMIAAPTFMMISGLVLGFLYQSQRDNFQRIKHKLIDKGLFLLTIGHIFITFAHVSLAGSLASAVRWGFVTDAIGFSVIMGAILINKIKLKERLVISFFLYCSSWLAILLWHPDNQLLRFVKESFVGSLQQVVYTYNFPLIPWFSLYFASTCLGQIIGNYSLDKKESLINSRLLQLGLLALALSVFIKISRDLIVHFQLVPVTPVILSLTTIYQKLPPSPVYFLFYGGFGLILIWVVFRLENAGVLNTFVEFTAILGKTSLFVFIVQYYVYFTALHVMNLGFTKVWPVYFIVSVLLISGISKIWHKGNYNRFLTIMYPYVGNSFSRLIRKFAS